MLSPVLRTAFLCSTLIGSVSVAAAPANVPDKQEIVVTATRMPTPLVEVLAPVLVIDRARIEGSAATDAADVLRFNAGLDLARNGGPGQTTAIFIRGADSNHTLVMVDGVRINPGTIGLAGLQNISPSMIERIEVVKGPRSALYGTDAIGGVINVITRRGVDTGWTAQLGYGDYDTQEASVSGAFATNRFELGLGASWLDSDGFPTRTDDDTDRGYENFNGMAQLRGDVGVAEVLLRYWTARGTSEYSDFFLTPVDQDFDTSTSTLTVAWPAGETARFEFGATRFEDRIQQNQSADYLETLRDAWNAQVDWRAGIHQLGTGAMYSHERAASESYGDAMRAVTDVLNVFVQDRFQSGAHRVLLALGYTDHETAGNAFTWNAEYGHALGEATLLYGLAGTGFRAPDASDRFGFGGNPALDPERSLNIEFGVRHRVNEHHALSLAAFRNDIHDLIEFVTLSFDPFVGENRNVDEARIEGVEATYEYSAGPWRARVEAIHQDPRNLTTGQQLYRRARSSLTVSAQRAYGPVTLGFDVLATGQRKDVGFPKPVTLDGYVLANLNATWQATRAVAVTARIENLLDSQYELADTFNTPDRGLYLALRYAPGPRAEVTSSRGPDPATAGAYSALASRSDREQAWATD
jgi:vitamin B12 transporter